MIGTTNFDKHLYNLGILDREVFFPADISQNLAVVSGKKLILLALVKLVLILAL